jgi:hypothetical protein
MNESKMEERLDSALRIALAPPPVPPGLRERVARSILREAHRTAADAASQIAARRREIELERVRELALLREGQVRMYRGTLALIVAVAFTAGASVSLALPYLHGLFGGAYTQAAPLLGVLAGVLAASVVWFGDDLRRRFLPDL